MRQLQNMRQLILLAVIAALPAHGDLKSNGQVIDTIDLWATGQTNIGGDTYHFTAWTGPGNGGKFNGGRIYGSYNDGSGCTGGGNIAFLEILAVDWKTKSNTRLACVNSMSGYGNAANTPPGWTEPGVAWKSFDPFSYNGNLYWFVSRQEIANPWRVTMSTVITSPDRGLHWCNPATFAAGGGTCTSSNWQANGDPPPNATSGMMWGAIGNYTSAMARPAIVQFCQDQNCSGMPFDADHFLYFMSTTGVRDMEYAVCVAKSPSAIMDVTQWWYKKADGNGNCGDTNYWTHVVSEAVPVQRQVTFGADNFGYPSSIIYIPQAGQFLMLSRVLTFSTQDPTTIFLTSQYPWGPWKRIFISSPTDPVGNFPSANLAWLDSSCSGCNTNPGHWQVTFAVSKYTHMPNASLFLQKMEIVNGGPSTPNTPQSGIVNLGRLPIRASNQGVGNRLILNGLALAYAFDEHQDQPASWWTNATYKPGVYTRNLLGSTDCMVAGANPPGYMVWGSQGSTAGIAYLASGITLGGYASQFNSGMGNCSGYVPLSGDAAWTVQLIWTPTSVTGTREGLLEIGATSSFGNHQQAMLRTNQNGGGGTRIGYLELGGGLLEATLPWTAGNTYLLTITKQSGVNHLSGVKFYLGKTNYPGTVTTSDDGAPTNYPSTMHLIAGCAENPITRCDNGTLQNAVASGTWSFLGLYNRVLSADEVAHNYVALKAAMAMRGVTVQ